MSLQDAFDDAVGMLIDLVEAYPIGMPGDHLAWSFMGRIAGEFMPLVSPGRQAEWDLEARPKVATPTTPNGCSQA